MAEQMDGRLEVSELCDRYSVTKAAFYGSRGRFNKAGIKTKQEWGRSWINAEQLAYLDHMDVKLKEGYTLDRYISEFGPYKPSIPDNPPDTSPVMQPALQTDGQTTEQADQAEEEPAGELVQYRDAELVVGYKDELVAVLESVADGLRHNERSPLWRHRDLQEALDNGWLLTTSQLGLLIERAPEYLARKTEYAWGGFVLRRAETKLGRELQWSVHKLNSPALGQS